jgi:riboflavin kinase / FMN adenylyltransferase
MRVLQSLQDGAGLPYPVVTIGNFDGVHAGHRAVLKLARERVQAQHGTVIVLTFEPHPLHVLAPGVELKFLSDPEEKLALLEQAGVDVVVRLPFTRDFADQTPEEFMVQVLRDGLGTRELYVGQNFRFGKARHGTIDTLKEAGPRLGFTVTVISPVIMESAPVSSTRIRDLVQAGTLREAAVLLGRPYLLRGTVIEGSRRGGALGFPTANLLPPAGRVLPPDGVYATHLRMGMQEWCAVTYIGTRPTFGQGARMIETYLLDGDQNLYGCEVTVAFHERLRGDQTFESADFLTRQIAADVDRARMILRGLSGAPARPAVS